MSRRLQQEDQSNKRQVVVLEKERARELTREGMDRIKSDGGDREEAVRVGDEEEEDVVLPGFRFHPTDDELVTFYLRRKVAKKSLSIEIIKEMDIYKHDPWDLPKASTVGGEKEWYFFCLRGRKYRNSIRPNRVTGSGFWKATGIDRPIYSASNTGECIGLKKSLVYYRGSAGKGTKTDWMMHEFRLPPSTKSTDGNSSPSTQEAEVWTICRIFKRNITYKKQPQVWKDQAPAAHKIPPPDSSSNTGSFESDTGDEYMNCFPTPSIPQSHGDMNLANGYYFKEGNQQFQGQWNTVPVPLATLQTPPMMAALHQNNVLSPVTNELYKDGYWEELGRMMEFTDPAAFYDCRYA